MANPIVIDISHHQADPIDFDKLKANGTIGVIFKATEGTTYVDPTYAKRNAAALRAGLCTAPYHFLKPGSIAQQMSYFILKTMPPEGSRVIIDYEDSGLKISDLELAIDELRKLVPDCEITVYGANGFLGAQLAGKKNEKLAACSLWVASYTTAKDPTVTNLKGTWPIWSLWQYSDKGTALGINSAIDANRWNGNAESLPGWFQADKAAPPAPEPKPPESVTVTVGISVPENVTVKVTVNGNPVD